MAPWRLRVQGTAGSGKTQLALQALREARAAGRGALYVCFNRPLADAMRQLAPDPGAVVTFHEFARLALAQAGRPDVAFDSPDAFDVLARGFIELAPAFAGTFDTLVIDEGQDFEPAWADSLVAMARPQGRLLWLEDAEQSLYDRAPVALPGWVTLASPVNYRSPRLLVDFINWLGLTAEAVEAGSAVVGFDPHWHVFDDAHPVQAATEQAVADLLAEGYEPERIAVLSVRGLAASLLAGAHGPARLAGLNAAGCETAKTALAADGWNVAALGDRALCLIEAKDVDAAKSLLDQLEAFAPDDWRVAVGRAAMAWRARSLASRSAAASTRVALPRPRKLDDCFKPEFTDMVHDLRARIGKELEAA